MRIGAVGMCDCKTPDTPIGHFFQKVFHVFEKYVMPGVCPICYGISKLPPSVLHGFEIFGGIGLLLSGNPAGIFFIALRRDRLLQG